MARPIRPRTTKGYDRDIERLVRLRTAIMMDSSIDSARANELSTAIDKLATDLIKLAKSLPTS
jgi:hypothetical protein